MLVTGGSGYLGGELLRQADGEAVGTYLSTPIEGGLRLDVRDAGAVARAVAGHDVVIHTAYVQSEDDVIVDGTVAVADACAAAGARLVHISTDVVFDGSLGRPYTEEDEPCPITDYGRAKLVAEQAVAERCPGAAIVRTSLIYGGPGRPPDAARAGRARRPRCSSSPTSSARPCRSPTWPRRCSGVARDRDRSGPIHLAGADGLSRHEFARLIVACHGGDPERVRGASFRELGMRRPADCRLASLHAAPLRGAREVLG